MLKGGSCGVLQWSGVRDAGPFALWVPGQVHRRRQRQNPPSLSFKVGRYPGVSSPLVRSVCLAWVAPRGDVHPMTTKLRRSAEPISSPSQDGQAFGRVATFAFLTSAASPTTGLII